MASSTSANQAQVTGRGNIVLQGVSGTVIINYNDPEAAEKLRANDLREEEIQRLLHDARSKANRYRWIIVSLVILLAIVVGSGGWAFWQQSQLPEGWQAISCSGAKRFLAHPEEFELFINCRNLVGGFCGENTYLITAASLNEYGQLTFSYTYKSGKATATIGDNCLAEGRYQTTSGPGDFQLLFQSDGTARGSWSNLVSNGEFNIVRKK
ncbi:MAG: hypothetical protein AAF399_09325 [Bacteroidota bacterium]